MALVALKGLLKRDEIRPRVCGEGRSVVTYECPEGAAGSYVGTDCGAENGEEDYEEEAKGAAIAGCGLVIDEGEGVVTLRVGNLLC
jgi:hypothetical protein